MFTFTRTNNTVKVTINVLVDEVIYLPNNALVSTRDDKIYINQGPVAPIYPIQGAFILSPLNVNGRPSDDAVQVAEWLTTTYFFGPDYGLGGGGGGSWPADYSTSGLQTSQLTKLQDVETELTAIKNKTASNLVSVPFDEKEIVYLLNGDIDYIAYKLTSTEVARVTFQYDVNDNLTNLIRS